MIITGTKIQSDQLASFEYIVSYYDTNKNNFWNLSESYATEGKTIMIIITRVSSD